MAQRFTQDGVIYEEAGNGQVRVVGYAPQGAVTLGTPDTNKATKESADATSAAQRAADAVAAAPYRAQSAADDFQIKHSQAIDAKAKSDNVEAMAKMATMAPNSEVHGEAYLKKYVPPQMQQMVRAYARGDLGSRAGGMSTSMLPIIQHAMNYDPTVSATTFPARAKMQQDLAGNQPNTLGGGLRAMEQMLFHGRDVLRNGAALNNYGPGMMGSIGNTVKTGYERLSDDPRLAAYNQSINNYAPESQKGVAGAAGIGAEREERHAAYSPTLSQASRAAALQADATMAFDRTGAVNDQYKRLMGKDIVDLLSPEAKKAYDEIMAGGHDASGKALHPAPGYVPGSVFGSAGNGGGDGPDGHGPSPIGIAGGPTKKVADPSKVAGIAALQTLLRSGAPDEQVRAAASGLGATPESTEAALQFRSKNPSYKGAYNLDALGTKDVPTTAMERISASPLATGVVSAGNAALGGLPGALTGTTPQMQAMAALNPKMALVGDIAGSTAGAIGAEGLLGKLAGGVAARYGVGAASRALASPITADAAFGGLSGASADPENPLGGAAAGATLGAGGGMFGRGLTRFAGQATRGVTNGAANLLRDAGVPLTAGQALSQSGRIGSVAKAFEDKLTSAPIVGDMIRARRLEGMQGFNSAAFDQGLAPIGATTNGVIGEAGVDAARGARSQAYRNTLDPVRVQADTPFVQDMQSAVTAGRALPDPMRANLDYTLPTRVGNSFGPNGELSGTDFQQSIRGLRRDAKSMAAQPYGHDFGQVTQQAEDALTGLLDRQAPGVVPAYQAANAANRNVEVLRDAVKRARNGTRVGEPGVFAPSQLADAASANAQKFGNSAGTTNQPFFDLSRAGQSVLPSSIPDSGTPGRLSALALPGVLGGAGYALGGTDGAETGSVGGLGLGAALALGGTRAGQRAMVSGLVDRPQALVRIGDALVDRRLLGGMFGAGAGTALATR